MKIRTVTARAFLLMAVAALAPLVWTPATGTAGEAPIRGFDSAIANPQGGVVFCTGLPALIPSLFDTEGRLTHIGPTTGLALITACELSQDGTFHADVIALLAGRNGDAIFLAGTLEIGLFSGVVTGALEIRGGTGRFSSATGALESVGSINFGTLTITQEITGTISMRGTSDMLTVDG